METPNKYNWKSVGNFAFGAFTGVSQSFCTVIEGK